MELDRVRRIVGARWWVLIALVGSGAAVAVGTATVRNTAIEPRFTATAPVVYQSDPLDAQGTGLSIRLQTAQERGLESTLGIFAQTPGASITIDEEAGELRFGAIGEDRLVATQRATALRDAFLENELVLEVADLDLQLRDLEEQITAIELQIADLITPTAEELESERQISNRNTQITDLTRQANQLRVELATAETAEETRAVQEELLVVEERITALEAEMAAIPRPDPAEEILESVRAQALARQVQGLEGHYQELFLRRAGLSEGGQEGSITIVDETKARQSLPAVGVLGALLGLVAGAGGLIFQDRMRPRLWLPNDALALAAAGVVPQRPPSDNEVWYLSAPPGARKAAIQRLRAAVDSKLATSKVVSVVGLGVGADQLSQLGVDLGASLSVTGRRVIVVDVSDTPTGSELQRTGVTTTELLRMDTPLEMLPDAALAGPNLYIVGRGHEIDADTIAAAGFRMLVDTLAQLADAVLVLGGAADSPVGHSLIQQTRSALLATRPGGVYLDEIAALAADLRERSVALVGLALVDTRRALGLGYLAATADRWSSGSRSSTVAPGRFEQLAAPAPTGALLTVQLIDYLRESQPELVADAVEEFLADRVVSLVTTLSDRFSSGQPVEPFIWLGPASSLDETLLSDLADEFGDPRAEQLWDSILVVLRDSLGLAGVEDWITQRFFPIHAALAAGNPHIWLLTVGGRFGALVDGDNLTRAAVEAIRSRVQLALVGLEGFSHRMPIEEQASATAVLENMRSFDAKLAMLLEGSTPEARIRYPGRPLDGQPIGWDPDLTQDRRGHLAPLQRLGLLPVRVLDESDLDLYAAST